VMDHAIHTAHGDVMRYELWQRDGRHSNE
jgi:hypothetical protein